MKYEGTLDEIHKDSALPNRDQYTYIGSVPELTKDYRAKFVFHCSECAKDEELFGNALFWSRKSDFTRGQLFCGCGKKVIWNLEQAIVKCERAAKEAGHIFHGIIQPFIGGKSRCRLQCNICQYSWTSALSNLWVLKRGCRSCRDTKSLAAAREVQKKPDDLVIKSFMATGRYHEDTVFTKIDRKAKNSRNNYWSVYCPVCNATVECQQGHLLNVNATTPCECSELNKKESYISLIKDGDMVVALKFGISRDSYKRLRTHQYNTTYDVEMFDVFRYEDSQSCNAAEQECLDTLICGVVGRDIFKHGWTETTHPYNLDKIIAIFKKHGGVSLSQVCS